MMKTFRLLIGLFAVIAFMSGNLYSQDVPSLGPAPYVLNKAPQSEVFDAAVGTRAFTQISTTPTFQFGKSFMESCTITNIGTAFTITFPGGLLYRNGLVYTWNQSSPFQLWQIDTLTGIHTFLFNMTGVPQANLTGMCWDGTNVYGVSSSLAVSQIFTVNMTTGVCTPIGTPSATCAGAIALLGRIGAQYSLFSWDIVLDNLYKWNKTTGVATLVGPLGANTNFGQDGCVDPNDNTFYAMDYSTGPELRKIDTTTGAFGPVLCTYTAQATGLACVPSTAPPPPAFYNEFCRTGIAIIINDFSLIRDSVQVPAQGNGCTVLDVNYKITNVTHTFDGDLTFYAQHLTTGSKIINRVGGGGANFINTVLNDSGITPIASGTAPFTGTFIPSNPLAPFNGQSPDGYWKIVITDTAGGDVGTLTGWCIQLKWTCPVGGIQTLEIPNYYSLSQNYPNPFNPSTVIKFTLPESQNVRLAVFDILGREVKTLVNEVRSSGVYEVNFDASALSSGVYFYRLVTDNFTDTKRMLLIK